MQHWFAYPNTDPVAFHIGPMPIHWYGISYLVGFICVYLWMNRPLGRARLGLASDQIQDFLVYALVGVLVGGRALFVIADMLSKHNAGDYFSRPINFIAVWNGGMAFHGALVGVIVAILVFLRKHPQLSFGVLADEIVVLLPVGIALTRVVNFINDELPGRLCRPDHPYCILFPAFPDGYRYPSQIFEAILDLLTLPVVLLLYRLRLPSGVVAWSWFTLYGITRSIAEIWRQPDIVVGGITGGQLLALPMIAIGIAMLILCYRNPIRPDARNPRPA